ncbi:hypothetical protein ILUMI_24586 [Ignelater luminosus]|uniref:Uncharacterized protein n=1 Tax=Ignelater luminosus TaxID=2038154 RepID=A0A8K0CC92_IGNLU|nr:hypothetical protein ILUMI_24586 [Ignelater luminosus]
MDEPSSSNQTDQLKWRELFLDETLQSENIKSTHFNVLTKDKYLELIPQVEEAEKTEKKTPLQQRKLQRTEFDICTQRFLQAMEVNQDIEISLRTTAATKHSFETGHGLVRCNYIKNSTTNGRYQHKKK